MQKAPPSGGVFLCINNLLIIKLKAFVGFVFKLIKQDSYFV